MVVEDFPDFWQWLLVNSGAADEQIPSAIGIFLFLVLIFAVGGTFFGYLVAALRHGPFEAFYVVAKTIAHAGPDLFRTSPKRVLAIAGMAAKEAMRRRVILVAFAIFALSLLFGGWFINAGVEYPERVYINFVLWGTQLLILMMVMLISSFSLPDDIRNRTIYTVATKPVRTTEMILGRIVGFGVLGTLLLFVMGSISLLFVWRGLEHGHSMVANDEGAAIMAPSDPNQTGHRTSEFAVLEGETSVDSDHQHFVEIIEDVRRADAARPSNEASIISEERRGDQIVYRRLQVQHAGGHTHAVTDTNKDEANLQVELGGASGFFRTRVPHYASLLAFYDRSGSRKREGLNVGEQWTYRGYINGGITLSRAEYLFSDFYPQRFDYTDLVPMDLSMSVYRSHKGDINRRVKVALQFENVVDADSPGPRIRSEIMEFESREFEIQVKAIPRKLPGQKFDADGGLIESGVFDLFDDYAANGQILLVVRCPDMGQYLGLAQGDIYFRASDRAYWWNFWKGYMGIWMQMMIVITLGVAFSTFLSAPVTMLAAMCTIVFGVFSEAIKEIALQFDNPDGRIAGGGPLESVIRLVTQKNTDQPLREGVGTTIIQELDKFFLQAVNSITNVVPNFSKMDFSDFMTYGYFVDGNRLLVALCLSAAFCAGLTILGYFCLKTRELAG